MTRLQQCPCGSGKYPEAQYDARGIFLCYTCSKCHTEKMRGYRPEVLTDPNYETTEDVEGDGEDDWQEIPLKDNLTGYRAAMNFYRVKRKEKDSEE